MAGSPVSHGSPAHTLTRRAWWCVALFVPSFAAAMVLGEGIPAWFGYTQPSLDTTPWPVIATAGLSALVVLALPLWPVLRFGRAAQAAGDPQGKTPVPLATVVVGGFVVLNLFGLLAQLIAK